MKKRFENNEWISKSEMVPQWQPIELLSFIGSKIDEILGITAKTGEMFHRPKKERPGQL